MDNRTVIEQLRILEQKTRRKIEGLHKSIEKELSVAENDLAHILGTIACMERGKESVSNPLLTTFARELEGPKLRGLTHKQAVVAIAKHNSGVIKSLDAKKLMIRAGIMKDTRNASRMVHNAIKGTHLFDPIAPGKFRLKTEPQDQGILTGDSHGLLTTPPGRLTN